MESNTHERLKEHVRELMEDSGWDVVIEAWFPESASFGQRDVIVDVLAEKHGKKIGIEVGDLNGRDVGDIQKYVDDVIHIPYETSKPVAVQCDLHQAVLLYSRLNQNSDSLKNIVSSSVLDRIRDDLDQDTMSFVLNQLGYSDMDELEEVVLGESISPSLLERTESELSQIID